MSLKPAADIMISVTLLIVAFFVDGFFFPALFNARSSFENLLAYLLAGGTVVVIGGWVTYLVYKHSWRQRMRKYFDEL